MRGNEVKKRGRGVFGRKMDGGGTMEGRGGANGVVLLHSLQQTHGYTLGRAWQVLTTQSGWALSWARVKLAGHAIAVSHFLKITAHIHRL
jgi:hypothetical protein